MLLCLHKLLLRLQKLLLECAVGLLLLGELLGCVLQTSLQRGSLCMCLLQLLLLQLQLLLLLAGLAGGSSSCIQVLQVALLLQCHMQLYLCGPQLILQVLHLLLQASSLLSLILQLLLGLVRFSRHLAQLPLSCIPALTTVSSLRLQLLQLAIEVLCSLLC